jgi:hypothetical protein
MQMLLNIKVSFMLHNLTITLIKETRSRLASDWQDGVAPFKMPPEHI